MRTSRWFSIGAVSTSQRASNSADFVVIDGAEIGTAKLKFGKFRRLPSAHLLLRLLIKVMSAAALLLFLQRSCMHLSAVHRFSCQVGAFPPLLLLLLLSLNAHCPGKHTSSSFRTITGACFTEMGGGPGILFLGIFGVLG